MAFPMISRNITKAADAGNSARSCSKGQSKSLDVNIQILPWKLLTQHGASFPGSGDHENTVLGLSKVARIAIAVLSSERPIALRSNGRLLFAWDTPYLTEPYLSASARRRRRRGSPAQYIDIGSDPGAVWRCMAEC